METHDIPDRAPSPWMPEADPYVVAILGKLGEESAELSAKIFRALIQGLEGTDPETGKPNSMAIRDEIADVQALAENAIRRLGFNREAITDRIERKERFKRPWFEWLRDLQTKDPQHD